MTANRNDKTGRRLALAGAISLLAHVVFAGALCVMPTESWQRQAATERPSREPSVVATQVTLVPMPPPSRFRPPPVLDSASRVAKIDKEPHAVKAPDPLRSPVSEKPPAPKTRDEPQPKPPVPSPPAAPASQQPPAPAASSPASAAPASSPDATPAEGAGETVAATKPAVKAAQAGAAPAPPSKTGSGGGTAAPQPGPPGDATSATSGPPRPATAGAGGMAAEVLDLPTPEYPPRSRRLGEEGLVLLEVEVLPDGLAGKVRVVQTPAFPRLVEAAVEAVRKARLSPATRNGRPVASVVEVPIRFRLSDR
jgi:protein TonB